MYLVVALILLLFLQIAHAQSDEITVKEWEIPTPNSLPHDIVVDKNGIVWFTEIGTNKIGRFDPKTEDMKEYDTSSASSGPYAIWVDLNDNVWFSMTGIYRVGKFDQTTQKLHEYDLPTPNTHIKFIHTDDNGNVWFPNYNNNKIGMIMASTPVVEATDNEIAPVEMPQASLEETMEPSEGLQAEQQISSDQMMDSYIIGIAITIGAVAAAVAFVWLYRKKSIVKSSSS